MVPNEHKPGTVSASMAVSHDPLHFLPHDILTLTAPSLPVSVQCFLGVFDSSLKHFGEETAVQMNPHLSNKRTHTNTKTLTRFWSDSLLKTLRECNTFWELMCSSVR